MAIDPSLTRTGVCVLGEGEERLLYAFRTSPEEGRFDRVVSIYDRCRAVMEKHRGRGSMVGVVEGLAMSKGASSSFSVLAELQGVLKLMYLQGGVPFVVAQQSWWKSSVMGKDLRGLEKRSREGREAYLERVRKRWGLALPNTDVADAFLMALAVRRVIEGKALPTGGAENVRLELERQGVEVAGFQGELDF
jgi:Holliday junction resolvasome RuvABC endonuclease subunit